MHLQEFNVYMLKYNSQNIKQTISDKVEFYAFTPVSFILFYIYMKDILIVLTQQ